MHPTSLTLSAVLIAVLLSPVEAQRPRVRVSPHETAASVVDGAKISITYGRPSMRGRKIFGGLVPYGRVWMPGADEATIFETAAPLRFTGGFLLPAGSYSLYTLPESSRWTLIINKMTGQFHTYYPADRDLAKLPMHVESLETPLEMLTISAVQRPGGGGSLRLEWERTRASVDFTVER